MNMNKPPAFQIYSKDWRSDSTIRQMSRAEKGDFIEMLLACWDQDEPGTLPLPLPICAKTVGIRLQFCRRLVQKYPHLWVERSDLPGRLVNPKLREQWEQMQQRQQAQSDAAKRTNEKRWGKASPSDNNSSSPSESLSGRSAFAFASASANSTPLRRKPRAAQTKKLDPNTRLERNLKAAGLTQDRFENKTDPYTRETTEPHAPPDRKC
jgi:hypothetical protein